MHDEQMSFTIFSESLLNCIHFLCQNFELDSFYQKATKTSLSQ